MTSRLQLRLSSGTPWHASTAGLGFLTTWWLGPQGKHSQEKNSGGSQITFCESVLENHAVSVLLRLFCQSYHEGLSDFKEERDSPSWWGAGRILKEQLGVGILLWSFLEHANCHRRFKVFEVILALHWLKWDSFDRAHREHVGFPCCLSNDL